MHSGLLQRRSFYCVRVGVDAVPGLVDLQHLVGQLGPRQVNSEADFFRAFIQRLVYDHERVRDDFL